MLLGLRCSPARLLLVWRGVRAQGRPFQVAGMLLRLGRKGWALQGVTERLRAAQRGDVPAAVAAQAGGDGLPGARV